MKLFYIAIFCFLSICSYSQIVNDCIELDIIQLSSVKNDLNNILELHMPNILKPQKGCLKKEVIFLPCESYLVINSKYKFESENNQLDINSSWAKLGVKQKIYQLSKKMIIFDSTLSLISYEQFKRKIVENIAIFNFEDEKNKRFVENAKEEQFEAQLSTIARMQILLVKYKPDGKYSIQNIGFATLVSFDGDSPQYGQYYVENWFIWK